MKSTQVLLLLKQNNILNDVVIEGHDFEFPDKNRSILKSDKKNKEQIIINSIFKSSFIAGCISFDSKISFINCVFENTAMFHGAIFEKKVVFENCIFNSVSEFSSTFFLKKAIITDCKFLEFLSFNAAQFKDEFIFKNNNLKKGTDLLGNLDKPNKVYFDKNPTIENNIGNLEMNILTE